MPKPYDPFNDVYLEDAIVDGTPHMNAESVKTPQPTDMAGVEFYWTDGIAQNHINQLTSVYGISSGLTGSEDVVTKRMFLEQLADKSRSLRDALLGLRNDPMPNYAY